jgi:hypothetical protein
MLFRIGPDHFPSRGYKLVRQGIVAGQPASAHEPSDTAAECQARDASRRNQTSCRCQAAFLSRSIELTSKQAGLRDRHPCTLVDLDAFHLGDVDNHSVVNQRCTRDIVPAGQDRRM